MNINTDLIYTGENFNLVLDTASNAKEAFEIAKNTLNIFDMENEAEVLELDEDNCKVCLAEGEIGNYNDLVAEICRAVATNLKSATFYGHAFYDDDNCGYESCADYEYEDGILKITIIESPNGHGFCPECGEQMVCFDEYNSKTKYICEECGAEISNHEDMFDGDLPTVKVIEEKID